jgi:hypothetical protein
MWLLLPTKKSLCNNLTSTSLAEADLGGEEEPEPVASGEDHRCIPREGANLAYMISSWPGIEVLGLHQIQSLSPIITVGFEVRIPH